MQLHANDGSQIPVRLSIWPMQKNGSKVTSIGMVVTNMTETRKAEELLRALAHRVVQAQETERGRVALELHDTVIQMLCGVMIRSQALMNRLPASDAGSKGEAIKLHSLLAATVEEVDRISRNLRPSVLDHLGLAAILRATGIEFSARTGMSFKLARVNLAVRLPADIELALYRILQETLKNVEKHARARHVTASLTRAGDLVQMTIRDDGIGFDPEHQPARRNGKGGLGLLGMRERAAYVGGVIRVKSSRRDGTDIEVSIPVPRELAAAKHPMRGLIP
jgi:signal transduction histidine kinase